MFQMKTASRFTLKSVSARPITHSFAMPRVNVFGRSERIIRNWLKTLLLPLMTMSLTMMKQRIYREFNTLSGFFWGLAPICFTAWRTKRMIYDRYSHNYRLVNYSYSPVPDTPPSRQNINRMETNPSCSITAG